MGKDNAEEFEQVFINNDDIIQGFQVQEKLDEGNYGQVFIVSKNGKKYAMKVEPKRLSKDVPALKTEIDIIMRLDDTNAKFFPKIVHSGVEANFHLMVMDLLGENLKKLRLKSSDPTTCSVGTWSRVGIQCLYVIKQMHDNGYTHNDIKPANFAMGPSEDVLNSRVLHLFDFGISRSFVRNRKGVFVGQTPTHRDLLFRLPKKKVRHLKGTPVYTSPNAHAMVDLGRRDDIWSLLYMIAELVEPLPWSALEGHELEKVKLKCPLKLLFNDEALDEVEKMLRDCDFYAFPNYEMVYTTFKKFLDSSQCSWLDPYDWETRTMPSYIRWKQNAEKRTTLFPWECSEVVNYFRNDPFKDLQEDAMIREERKRRDRKKQLEPSDNIATTPETTANDDVPATSNSTAKSKRKRKGIRSKKTKQRREK